MPNCFENATRSFAVTAVLALVGSLGVQLARAQAAGGADAGAPGAPGLLRNPPNPYRLQPFHDAFPIELQYPPLQGRDYQRTRRQVLERLAANLQGHVSKRAWHIATEFYWRAPDDAVEPLIEAMDRAMVNPSLAKVVGNCCEAMGKMASEQFDAALRRALQHKTVSVHQGAYAALAHCGTAETLLGMRAAYYRMDGRSRRAWLMNVRRRLPLDKSVPLLRELMEQPLPPSARDEILFEARRLPAKAAAEVLAGSWDEAKDDFKAILAGMLHAAGDVRGTIWLREALVSESVQELKWAVTHCVFGDDPNAAIGDLRGLLLRATTHQSPEIRLAAARRLASIDGDDVTGAFEVLTAPDETWDVRSIALRVLNRRGKSQAVSVLLEELPTATGTRLVQIVNELSVSGDERGVPIILERFRRAGPGEGRPFLQALSQNGSRAAATALCEILVGPDKLVANLRSGPLTTRSYVPTLLLNVRGSERVIVDAFNGLPADQWLLRASLMQTLAGVAADRRGQAELQQQCIAPLRRILFDREELPQLRVLALNLLTRNWLTIDDVMKLKNTRREEKPGMQAFFADFLNAYF